MINAAEPEQNSLTERHITSSSRREDVAWVRRVVVNRSISAGRRRVVEGRAMLWNRSDRVVVPELSADNEGLWLAVRGLPRRQAQVIALRCFTLGPRCNPRSVEVARTGPAT